MAIISSENERDGVHGRVIKLFFESPNKINCPTGLQCPDTRGVTRKDPWRGRSSVNISEVPHGVLDAAGLSSAQ